MRRSYSLQSLKYCLDCPCENIHLLTAGIFVFCSLIYPSLQNTICYIINPYCNVEQKVKIKVAMKVRDKPLILLKQT